MKHSSAYELVLKQKLLVRNSIFSRLARTMLTVLSSFNPKFGGSRTHVSFTNNRYPGCYLFLNRVVNFAARTSNFMIFSVGSTESHKRRTRHTKVPFKLRVIGIYLHTVQWTPAIVNQKSLQQTAARIADHAQFAGNPGDRKLFY